MKKRYQKGSIALTTVIIVSAILLSAGITLLINSIDLANSSKGRVALAKAQFQRESCLEESARVLRINSSYEGTVNLDLANGESCEAIITTDAGNSAHKNISVTVEIDGFVQEYTRTLDTSNDMQVIE